MSKKNDMNSRISSAAEWALFNLEVQNALLTQHLPGNPADKHRSQRNAITAQLEDTFLKLVVHVAPDTVLEIGAHAAEFSIAARKLLPSARMIAFEPNPIVFERYRDHIQVAGVELHQLAIADRAGEVEFSIPLNRDGKPYPTMGSIREIQFRGEVEHSTVRAVRADEFVAVEPANTVALWVDVEGAAYEALKGCEGFLSNTQLVYVEVECIEKWEGQSQVGEIIDLLSAYELIPIVRDIFRPDWQFNCIFAKADLLQDSSVKQMFVDFVRFHMIQKVPPTV